MLGSKHCYLSGRSNKTKSEMGECFYDMGGYFIINGSEKVIVSQDKFADNLLVALLCSYRQDAWLKKI